MTAPLSQTPGSTDPQDRTDRGAPPGPQPSDQELFRALRAATGPERERIRERLVIRHAGLVRWLAARYAHPGIDREELCQVGYLGLVLAIDRFDVERGNEFTSYARPTVQGEIRRWFRDKRRWIRLPRRLQETKVLLRAASEVLTHRLGREPTLGELATHCELPVACVAEAIDAQDHFTVASVDGPVGNDGDESFSLADVLGAPDPSLDLVVDLAALRPLLAALDERDRQVLHLRFGQNLTQAQIGARLGCSQMQVSRLLSAILTRLRTILLTDAPQPTGSA